jgi:hypothetical protein
MNEDFEFQKWGSISRLFRPILITEKIDGTNAQIYVADREEAEADDYERGYEGIPELPWIFVDDFALLAGSRKRYLDSKSDNFGFHQWVSDNAGALVYLGPGRHFGEWWGKGIQRGYDKKDRTFSLFNVFRYSLDPSLYKPIWNVGVEVVPLLYAGDWGLDHIQMTMKTLEVTGSIASPGYYNPEGIVIFHTHGKVLFKTTLDGDQHKSQIMEEKMLTLQEVII